VFGGWLCWGGFVLVGVLVYGSLVFYRVVMGVGGLGCVWIVCFGMGGCVFRGCVMLYKKLLCVTIVVVWCWLFFLVWGLV
jgi:hypothetical protein